MAELLNKSLEQLFSELRFAPRAQKEKQLAASEELLRIIDPAKDYPFEFICFRITEYRLRTVTEEKIINGRELAHDLHVFINTLSDQLELVAAEQQEKVYTTDDLTSRFSVSAKTISRWRQKGLKARIFVFDDGQKRLGFFQSAVDGFVNHNPDIIENAAKFTRLTARQKDDIIKTASELLSKNNRISRYQVILTIAAEMKRSPEAVRYVLADYEKTNPDKHLFKKPAGVLGSKEVSQICRLHSQGTKITELAEKFNRSRSSIYRIINARRVRELLARKITFTESPEFTDPDADEKILPDGWRSLTRQMAQQKIIPLLTRRQETDLFRRYNYLKHQVCLIRGKINPESFPVSQLRRMQEYLSLAEDVKKIIIEANLRLVASIAGKHLGTGASMAELVSEGNFSLMRTVEKFDYTRGYRFSTFATWVITKDFARKIPTETLRLDRAGTTDFANIQQDARAADIVDFAAIERARRSLDEVITNNLTEREQFIVRNHFALKGGPIKKKAKSLKEIGDELGVTKERVRQIELVALQKLRHSLSPEQFDLLTG